MKVGIARLRNVTKYTQPLEHIVDSHLYLLQRYIQNHPEIEFKYFNVTFDGSKPVKDGTVLKDCDFIIIPTENEFHYQMPNFFPPIRVTESNETVQKVTDNLKKQKIVLLTSDKGDTIDLYRDKVFKKDMDYVQIDEDDFPYNIHSLKYHFIREADPNVKRTSRNYDFVYWGSSKRKGFDGKTDSGDERHVILNEIRKAEMSTTIKSCFIGRMDRFKPTVQWQRTFNKILPYLKQGKVTLCFNWLDSPKPTARYHEALGCGVIPLVWKQYDYDNTLVSESWQRCHTLEKVIEHIKMLTEKESFRKETFAKLEANYEKKLPSKDETYNAFEKLLKKVGIE